MRVGDKHSGQYNWSLDAFHTSARSWIIRFVLIHVNLIILQHQVQFVVCSSTNIHHPIANKSSISQTVGRRHYIRAGSLFERNNTLDGSAIVLPLNSFQHRPDRHLKVVDNKTENGNVNELNHSKSLVTSNDNTTSSNLSRERVKTDHKFDLDYNNHHHHLHDDNNYNDESNENNTIGSGSVLVAKKPRLSFGPSYRHESRLNTNDDDPTPQGKRERRDAEDDDEGKDPVDDDDKDEEEEVGDRGAEVELATMDNQFVLAQVGALEVDDGSPRVEPETSRRHQLNPGIEFKRHAKSEAITIDQASKANKQTHLRSHRITILNNSLLNYRRDTTNVNEIGYLLSLLLLHYPSGNVKYRRVYGNATQIRPTDQRALASVDSGQVISSSFEPESKRSSPSMEITPPFNSSQFPIRAKVIPLAGEKTTRLPSADIANGDQGPAGTRAWIKRILSSSLGPHRGSYTDLDGPCQVGCSNDSVMLSNVDAFSQLGAQPFNPMASAPKLINTMSINNNNSRSERRKQLLEPVSRLKIGFERVRAREGARFANDDQGNQEIIDAQGEVIHRCCKKLGVNEGGGAGAGDAHLRLSLSFDVGDYEANKKKRREKRDAEEKARNINYHLIGNNDQQNDCELELGVELNIKSEGKFREHAEDIDGGEKLQKESPKSINEQFKLSEGDNREGELVFESNTLKSRNSGGEIELATGGVNGDREGLAGTEGDARAKEGHQFDEKVNRNYCYIRCHGQIQDSSATAKSLSGAWHLRLSYTDARRRRDLDSEAGKESKSHGREDGYMKQVKQEQQTQNPDQPSFVLQSTGEQRIYYIILPTNYSCVIKIEKTLNGARVGFDRRAEVDDCNDYTRGKNNELFLKKKHCIIPIESLLQSAATSDLNKHAATTGTRKAARAAAATPKTRTDCRVKLELTQWKQTRPSRPSFRLSSPSSSSSSFIIHDQAKLSGREGAGEREAEREAEQDQREGRKRRRGRSIKSRVLHNNASNDRSHSDADGSQNKLLLLLQRRHHPSLRFGGSELPLNYSVIKSVRLTNKDSSDNHASDSGQTTKTQLSRQPVRKQNRGRAVAALASSDASAGFNGLSENQTGRIKRVTAGLDNNKQKQGRNFNRDYDISRLGGTSLTPKTFDTSSGQREQEFTLKSGKQTNISNTNAFDRNEQVSVAAENVQPGTKTTITAPISHSHHQKQQQQQQLHHHEQQQHQFVFNEELIELLAQFYGHTEELQDKIDRFLVSRLQFAQSKNHNQTVRPIITNNATNLITIQPEEPTKSRDNNPTQVTPTTSTLNLADLQHKSLGTLTLRNQSISSTNLQEFLHNNNNTNLNDNNYNSSSSNSQTSTISNSRFQLTKTQYSQKLSLISQYFARFKPTTYQRFKMHFGADDESLLKWLRGKQEQYSTLKNITIDLISEPPKRAINVCLDGPKIWIYRRLEGNRTLNDIYYCYTHDQWIEKLWLDWRPSPYHYPLLALNILIFLFGATGNIFVCLSVYRNHQLRNVTNYHIVNLAVADLLVIIICLPATSIWDVSLTWFFGTIPCKLIMYLQDVSISVSVLTLAAISIDRYYAICYPLRFKSSLSKAKRVICCIWLLSLTIMLPDLIYLAATQSLELSEAGLNTILYSDCNYTWTEQSSRLFQYVKTILLYFVPFVFMFVAHFRIMRTLRDSTSSGPAAAAAAGAPAGPNNHKNSMSLRKKQEQEGDGKARNKSSNNDVALVVTGSLERSSTCKLLSEPGQAGGEGGHKTSIDCNDNHHQTINQREQPTSALTIDEPNLNPNIGGKQLRRATVHSGSAIGGELDDGFINHGALIKHLTDRHSKQPSECNKNNYVIFGNNDGHEATRQREPNSELDDVIHSNQGAGEGDNDHDNDIRMLPMNDAKEFEHTQMSDKPGAACDVIKSAETNSAEGGNDSACNHEREDGPIRPDINQIKTQNYCVNRANGPGIVLIPAGATNLPLDRHQKRRQSCFESSPGRAAAAAATTTATATANVINLTLPGPSLSGANQGPSLLASLSKKRNSLIGGLLTQSNVREGAFGAQKNSVISQSLLNRSGSFCVAMHNKSQLESRRNAAKMLMAIVIFFGLSHLPVHLMNFLRHFIEDLPQNDFTLTMSMVAHSLCHLNSAINPIIYNYMNSVFRAEFRKSLSCLLCSCNGSGGTSGGSVSQGQAGNGNQRRESTVARTGSMNQATDKQRWKSGHRKSQEARS